MKSGRTLLTIACRVGSKGIRRKCERLVFGKLLAQWTIEQALKYKLTDVDRIDVVLSTDSQWIQKIGRDVFGEYNHNFVGRPEKLWGDHCGKPEVLKHILSSMYYYGNYDTLIDLDVCNPLREKFDIVLANNLLNTIKTTRVISVARAPVNPFYNAYTKDSKAGAMDPLAPFTGWNFKRRQDAPVVFIRNNSIFAYKTEWFENMDDSEPWMPYYMPDNTGGVDVDHEHNLRWLECEMKHAGF